MCYLEEYQKFVEFINEEEQHQKHHHKQQNKHIIVVHDEEPIHSLDLDLFFRSIGSIFITYITSSTLNNLLLSSVINNRSGINLDNILCNNSLLKIFSSELDMNERCRLFNKKYGEHNSVNMECTIWNLSYFNIINNKYQFQTQYNHKMMMKMIISYICMNGMHPFLGINCDEAPNCQWSNNPKCRIRSVFEKLLANKDYYDINRYDFDYREAWRMRNDSANLLIDVNEMMEFLFVKQNNDEEIGAYDIIDVDVLDAFRNNEFTLFTFRNECDFTHKIQFDIIHCNSNLDVIDNFQISLFGKKIHFGSFPMHNMDKKLWNQMKNVLLGHKFVNIQHWWVISIQSIDTSLENVEQNKCYYVICAEVEGTYIDHKHNADLSNVDHMYSKLMVWKSCFYSEQQPYGHE